MAELSLVWVVMLVSRQAVSVEGAGLQLAVPRDPKLVCRVDERCQVLLPQALGSWRGVHVERAIDDLGVWV